MAAVSPPRLLAFQTGIGAGEFSTVFAPTGGGWEVNSLVASGPVSIYRAFDFDNDSTFESIVEVESGPAGEFHGYKFQCTARAGLQVKNLGQTSIWVALLGVEVTE